MRDAERPDVNWAALGLLRRILVVDLPPQTGRCYNRNRKQDLEIDVAVKINNQKAARWQKRFLQKGLPDWRRTPPGPGRTPTITASKIRSQRFTTDVSLYLFPFATFFAGQYNQPFETRDLEEPGRSEIVAKLPQHDE